MDTIERNHALENAKAGYSAIAEMVAALDCDFDRLEELRDENEAARDLAENSDPECRAEYQQKWAGWTFENGDELRELTEAATVGGDLLASQDDARERIQEDALSVEVRSGWETNASHFTASEFRILLTTGGPALQIRGETNEHGEPSRAWLEYQDWGTPWTQYFNADQATLLTYCQQFYFGE